MKRDYGTNGNNWERARLERMPFTKRFSIEGMRSRDERAPSYFRLFRNLS